jgi:hypothetical protein
MKKSTRKLTLNRETLRGLSDTEGRAQVAGGRTAGAECSGNYTSCGSQWPNCNFTSTCPPGSYTSCEIYCPDYQQ